MHTLYVEYQWIGSLKNIKHSLCNEFQFLYEHENKYSERIIDTSIDGRRETDG